MFLSQRKKYWVLYDEKGKLLIQTYDRRIAEGFAKRIRKQKIIDITLAVLILGAAIGLMVAVIYYLGKGEGKW